MVAVGGFEPATDGFRSSRSAASASARRCSPHLNHSAVIGTQTRIFLACARASARFLAAIPEGVARLVPKEDDATRPTLYGEPALRSSLAAAGEGGGGRCDGAPNMRDVPVVVPLGCVGDRGAVCVAAAAARAASMRRRVAAARRASGDISRRSSAPPSSSSPPAMAASDARGAVDERQLQHLRSSQNQTESNNESRRRTKVSVTSEVDGRGFVDRGGGVRPVQGRRRRQPRAASRPGPEDAGRSRMVRGKPRSRPRRSHRAGDDGAMMNDDNVLPRRPPPNDDDPPR